MRFKILFLAAAMTIAWAALPLLRADDAPPAPGDAASSTTAPSANTTTQPDQSPASNYDGRRLGQLRAFQQALRNAANPPPVIATQQEWDRLDRFLQAVAPNRYRLMQDVDVPHNAPIMQMMMHRWQTYLSLRERFPEVADLHLQRFKIDDKLLGVVMKARANPDPTSRPDYALQISDYTRQLADLNIKEEKLRVAKLSALLDQEKQLLTQDEEREENLINRRVNHILTTIGGDTPDSSTTRPQTNDNGVADQ